MGRQRKVRKRRALNSKFKPRLALAAMRGDRTLSQLASHFDLHGNQVCLGKESFRNEHLSSSRMADVVRQKRPVKQNFTSRLVA